MTRLDEYTFIVTDLLTGNVIDTVELSSFHWEDIYKGAGNALATARFDAETTTPANFRSWRNGLWAVQDDTIRWGGIIGKVQRRSGTRVISVPVHGFLMYLRSRILRSDVGMTHGNLVRTSDIEWVGVDQFNMAADLLNHIQDPSFTDGNLNIQMGWNALSGITVTKVHKTTAVRFVGDIFEELSWRLNGFDWNYTYGFNGNNPFVEITLKYPQLGYTNPATLIYQPETTQGPVARRSNIVAYDNDGVEEPVTGLAIIGQGEGDDQILIFRQNTNGQAPLWETRETFKHDSEVDLLTEMGDATLMCYSALLEQFTLELDHTLEPAHHEILTGDKVRVVINDAFTQADALFYVGRKRVTLSKQQDERTTLEVMQVAT